MGRFGMRVLVVDDDRDLAESFSDFLEECGHSAEAAFDGQSALSSLRGGTFNVVLLDFRMPGMSGVDVLREIRALGIRLSVIMMTGYSVPELLDEAWELGADQILDKPVDMIRIQELLA